MQCQRCHGLLVAEREAYAAPETATWRCINCGDVLDQVVAYHRTFQLAVSSPFPDPALSEADLDLPAGRDKIRKEPPSRRQNL